MNSAVETLLSQAPLGVYVVDANFRVRDVVPRADISSEIPDLVGATSPRCSIVLWPRDCAQEVAGLFHTTTETGESLLMKGQAPRRSQRDGVLPRMAASTGFPFRTEDMEVVCYFRDISRRSAREAAIADSGRYRSLVSITDVPWTTDINGAFVTRRTRGKPTRANMAGVPRPRLGSTQSTGDVAGYGQAWQPAPAMPRVRAGATLAPGHPRLAPHKAKAARYLMRRRSANGLLLHGHRGPDSRRASAQGRARRCARGQSRQGRVPRGAFPRAAHAAQSRCC